MFLCMSVAQKMDNMNYFDLVLTHCVLVGSPWIAKNDHYCSCII